MFGCQGDQVKETDGSSWPLCSLRSCLGSKQHGCECCLGGDLGGLGCLRPCVELEGRGSIEKKTGVREGIQAGLYHQGRKSVLNDSLKNLRFHFCPE
jgi:hypothetical protein